MSAPVEGIMNKNPLVAKIGINKNEILNILMKKNIQIIPLLNNNRRVVKYFHITDFIKEEFLKNDVKEKLDSKISKRILVTGGAGYI
ncbi:unnamed protein product, partial [marine sediment metagenome]